MGTLMRTTWSRPRRSLDSLLPRRRRRRRKKLPPSKRLPPLPKRMTERPRRRRRRRRRPLKLPSQSCVLKDQWKQLHGSESADFSWPAAGGSTLLVHALIKTFLRSGQPHGLDVSYCRLVLSIKYNYARFL